MLPFTAGTHQHYGRFVEYDLTESKPDGFGILTDYYKNGPIGIKIFVHSAPKDIREPEIRSCILAKAAMDRQKKAAEKELGPLAYNLCRAKMADGQYLWGYTTEHAETSGENLENMLYDERVVSEWKKNATLSDYSIGRFMILAGIRSPKYEATCNMLQNELSKIDISDCTEDFKSFDTKLGENRMMFDDINYENIGYCPRLNKLVVIDFSYQILGELKNEE